MMALTGRSALVTGGSRGIGRTIVERLVRDGARVYFTYRSRAADAAELVESLSTECHQRRNQLPQRVGHLTDHAVPGLEPALRRTRHHLGLRSRPDLDDHQGCRPIPQDPQNHLLVAHCGFFGVVPQSFATQWALRPRVLEIVDPRSNVIDARFPEGSTTIVKITSDLRGLVVTPAPTSVPRFLHERL